MSDFSDFVQVWNVIVLEVFKYKISPSINFLPQFYIVEVLIYNNRNNPTSTVAKHGHSPWFYFTKLSFQWSNGMEFHKTTATHVHCPTTCNACSINYTRHIPLYAINKKWSHFTYVCSKFGWNKNQRLLNMRMALCTHCAL